MSDDDKSKWGEGGDNLNQMECLTLDVRPILARGVDPREQILAMVDQMKPDNMLLIEAPFDPVPLRRLLAERGFESQVKRISDTHWQILFKLGEMPPLPDLPDLPPFPMIWISGELEMDLRDLDPPNPMIVILKVIESGEGGDAFTVRLIRDPIYLYPELVERNWRAQIISQNEKELRARIFKSDKKGRE